jgi:hypothetical protein
MMNVSVFTLHSGGLVVAVALSLITLSIFSSPHSSFRFDDENI